MSGPAQTMPSPILRAYMPITTGTHETGTRRRRADAERSVQAILDAALAALTNDPDASMSEIARQAGVVRATVYVHFPTREALIATITDRALAETSEALRAVNVRDGEPAEALSRMLSVSWKIIGRYRALVAINSRPWPEHLRSTHEPILRRIRPLLKRGQNTGAFNRDLSLGWMQTVLLELIHAASREVSADRLSEPEAERALIATVTGALAPPPKSQATGRTGSRARG
jgi:TetR/AcrR family transcriptional regulator, mexCD-oprJ operon repressor